ncbi:hypothetical protein F5887DRAFT_925578 [Amanita rubescens]|nr:hypothetical protein F5887DRAFT_925578 [Amanita rubescens]
MGRSSVAEGKRGEVVISKVEICVSRGSPGVRKSARGCGGCGRAQRGVVERRRARESTNCRYMQSSIRMRGEKDRAHCARCTWNNRDSQAIAHTSNAATLIAWAPQLSANIQRSTFSAEVEDGECDSRLSIPSLTGCVWLIIPSQPYRTSESHLPNDILVPFARLATHAMKQNYVLHQSVPNSNPYRRSIPNAHVSFATQLFLTAEWTVTGRQKG